MNKFYKKQVQSIQFSPFIRYVIICQWSIFATIRTFVVKNWICTTNFAKFVESLNHGIVSIVTKYGHIDLFFYEKMSWIWIWSYYWKFWFDINEPILMQFNLEEILSKIGSIWNYFAIGQFDFPPIYSSMKHYNRLNMIYDPIHPIYH